jgi:hypothetical protein
MAAFSSDRVPWYLGSTVGLRGRKGEMFIARYPEFIPSGQI